MPRKDQRPDALASGKVFGEDSFEPVYRPAEMAVDESMCFSHRYVERENDQSSCSEHAVSSAVAHPFGFVIELKYVLCGWYLNQ